MRTLLIIGMNVMLTLPAAAQIAVTASLPQRPTATAPASAKLATASVEVVCTDQNQKEWLSVDEFKLIVASRGYKTLKFKISKGRCYEIYGYDKQGRLVEVYFDPVNAKLKRENWVKL